ncbi:hypothetical protein [Chitinophaga sancti]|uniref:Microcystin-dependent protein n=1 Tax=Chitinophaga sancti TaxID=1004 RepID=A0A1K1LQ17_9BACT|nr:hypothetical protein [Chitinophaga sancti]WQD64941.1 hypothetical protein U0033_11100 [Chitinophaga sancti]WQG89435.1 hypothetical protein SR876_31370 [Chitinophaga sancti]SFW12947.1 hypothetical protein SAMN05661012_00120 [Chitinophaga sancti]
MNKIEQLTNLGGFPMTQYTLAFMQSSYHDALAGLSKMIGNAVIVSGMEEVGNNVADGWISYEGELLPFVGGPKLDTWIVEELMESRLFADQVTRNVYFTKRARFGSGGIAYGNLQRIETLLSLRDTIANLKASFTQQLGSLWKKGDVIQVDCDTKYILENFDSTGLGKNERAGWAICNGFNNTNNRMGKFPIGYDPSRMDYNAPGKTGGVESVTLSMDQMPQHTHRFSATGEAFGFDNGYASVVSTFIRRGGDFDASMVPAGGSQAHENRPPFIVTLFIMKL